MQIAKAGCDGRVLIKSALPQYWAETSVVCEWLVGGGLGLRVAPALAK